MIYAIETTYSENGQPVYVQVSKATFDRFAKALDDRQLGRYTVQGTLRGQRLTLTGRGLDQLAEAQFSIIGGRHAD